MFPAKLNQRAYQRRWTVNYRCSQLHSISRQAPFVTFHTSTVFRISEYRLVNKIFGDLQCTSRQCWLCALPVIHGWCHFHTAIIHWYEDGVHAYGNDFQPTTVSSHIFLEVQVAHNPLLVSCIKQINSWKRLNSLKLYKTHFILVGTQQHISTVVWKSIDLNAEAVCWIRHPALSFNWYTYCGWFLRLLLPFNSLKLNNGITHSMIA